MKYLLLAPAIAFASLFFVWPVITLFQYSVLDTNFISTSFAGFGNYLRALTNPAFMQSWVNSLFYMVLMVTGSVGGSLLVALTVYPLKKRWHDATRIILYIPALAAGVIIAQAWRWIFHSAGPVNWMIQSFGGKPVAFFMRQVTAIPAIAIIVITAGLGGGTIILLASILGIDNALFDAAAIDGASPLQVKLRIVIPALRPMLALLSLLSMIGSLQIFETIYSLAPYTYTATVTFHIYREAFVFGRYGLASAQASILLFATIGLTVLKRRLERV